MLETSCGNPYFVRALGTHTCSITALTMRPQVRRGYPLSLSISISGGKETNKDSLSNGERTGKSPPWESVALRRLNCSLGKRPQWRAGANSPGRGRQRGGEPRRARTLSHHEALSASRVVWECSPNRAVKSGQGSIMRRDRKTNNKNRKRKKK